MGFPQFFRFLEEYDLLYKFNNQKVNINNENINEKPWLIIDYYNVFYKHDLETGSHQKLSQEYQDRFWEAVLKLNYNIKIFTDGDSDAYRIVTKINRIVESNLNTLKFNENSDWTEYFKIERKDLNKEDILPSFSKSRFSHISSILKKAGNVVAKKERCRGEADVEIRQFIRDKLNNNEKCFVFSEDASLILGIKNIENLYIINPKYIELRPNETDNSKSNVYGKITSINNFIQYLNI